MRKGAVYSNRTNPQLTSRRNRWVGKWFDSTLSNKDGLQTMTASRRGLRRIANSELSTPLKAWMFQHILIVRLIWQLTLYVIPTSTVVKLEQLISKLLRRWLGLSLNAFSKIELCIRQTPRCLTVCWWSCIRLQRNASYSHSDTLLMRRQVVQAAHKSGQEWSVRQAEEQAKYNLKHK